MQIVIDESKITTVYVHKEEGSWKNIKYEHSIIDYTDAPTILEADKEKEKEIEFCLHPCTHDGVKLVYREEDTPPDGEWLYWFDKYGHVEKARMKIDAQDHFYPNTKKIREINIIGWAYSVKKEDEVKNKLLEYLVKLETDIPCDYLNGSNYCCETCHYDKPVKECWLKWAEAEAEVEADKQKGVNNGNH